jgi:hypothetical protein
LNLYEPFASATVLYIQKPVFFFKLELLLLNRAFIDEPFGENCPNCRKERGGGGNVSRFLKSGKKY